MLPWIVALHVLKFDFAHCWVKSGAPTVAEKKTIFFVQCSTLNAIVTKLAPTMGLGYLNSKYSVQYSHTSLQANCRLS